MREKVREAEKSWGKEERWKEGGEGRLEWESGEEERESSLW